MDVVAVPQIQKVECQRCHVEKPRAGMRDGVCEDCGVKAYERIPASRLARALWFLNGGRSGVRRQARDHVSQIIGTEAPTSD